MRCRIQPALSCLRIGTLRIRRGAAETRQGFPATRAAHPSRAGAACGRPPLPASSRTRLRAVREWAEAAAARRAVPKESQQNGRHGAADAVPGLPAAQFGAHKEDRSIHQGGVRHADNQERRGPGQRQSRGARASRAPLAACAQQTGYALYTGRPCPATGRRRGRAWPPAPPQAAGEAAAATNKRRRLHALRLFVEPPGRFEG